HSYLQCSVTSSEHPNFTLSWRQCLPLRCETFGLATKGGQRLDRLQDGLRVLVLAADRRERSLETPLPKSDADISGRRVRAVALSIFTLGLMCARECCSSRDLHPSRAFWTALNQSNRLV